jgi:catechol 2,3-dioxygenase-like lactoylglutathione lyase family enzyme
VIAGGAFPTADMELTRLLVVSDIERSRDWYANVLGAEVVREYGGAGPRERRVDLPSARLPGGPRDAAGARGPVLAPPRDNGYEVRAFFRDPDGHLFEISSVAG